MLGVTLSVSVLVPVFIATGYSLVFVAAIIHVCAAIGPIHPHMSPEAQSRLKWHRLLRVMTGGLKLTGNDVEWAAVDACAACVAASRAASLAARAALSLSMIIINLGRTDRLALFIARHDRVRLRLLLK
jgi:hypothetical protein